MSASPAAPWPEVLTVLVEVRRGSLVKRGSDGGVDFVSVLPCPFDYGSVPGTRGPDGEPEDAVVLGGPARRRGARVTLPVQARVAFLDGGLDDPKWVCAARPLRRRDRLALTAFFRLYAVAKQVTAPVRRVRGPTRFGGIAERPLGG